MNSELISFGVGYFIVVNIIGISIIWLKVRTPYIKIEDNILKALLVVLSLIGGFIGTLVGAEMLNYEQEKKLFKRWIPFFIFIEACVVFYIIYNQIK